MKFTEIKLDAKHTITEMYSRRDFVELMGRSVKNNKVVGGVTVVLTYANGTRQVLAEGQDIKDVEWKSVAKGYAMTFSDILAYGYQAEDFVFMLKWITNGKVENPMAKPSAKPKAKQKAKIVPKALSREEILEEITKPVVVDNKAKPQITTITYGKTIKVCDATVPSKPVAKSKAKSKSKAKAKKPTVKVVDLTSQVQAMLG